jgi:hypothetical protein
LLKKGEEKIEKNDDIKIRKRKKKREEREGGFSFFKPLTQLRPMVHTLVVCMA